MTADGIATVVALLLGPILAVGVTMWAQNRAAIRNQRVWILQTLMATRLDQYNPERVKALSLIDLVFRRAPSVRSKWKEYFESLANPLYDGGKNDGVAVWRRKQNEMLAEIAQFLGYGKDIKYEEIERAYLPQQFVNNAVRQQKLSNELLRLLEGSEHLGTPRRTPETPPQPPT